MAAGEYEVFKVCIAEGSNNDFAVYIGFTDQTDREVKEGGQKVSKEQGEAIRAVLMDRKAIAGRTWANLTWRY